MSAFAMLMIGGWTSAIVMFGVCALKESGKLLEIHKRIRLWLESLATRLSAPEESAQPERENVA